MPKNTERLAAIMTLLRMEHDLAPVGPVRQAIVTAGRALTDAVGMLEDVETGACASCGGRGAHDGSCANKPADPDFLRLLDKSLGAPNLNA